MSGVLTVMRRRLMGVCFEAPYEIISGTILPVLVTDANGYDLIGEILPEEDD